MPPLPSPSTLTAAAARRIALAAQGFDRPRPGRPPSVNQIAALVGRLGVLQLDSVNVFLPRSLHAGVLPAGSV